MVIDKNPNYEHGVTWTDANPDLKLKAVTIPERRWNGWHTPLIHHSEISKLLCDNEYYKIEMDGVLVKCLDKQWGIPEVSAPIEIDGETYYGICNYNWCWEWESTVKNKKMTEKELKQIAQNAQEEFWSNVAEMLPEITTGDFPPCAKVAFDAACESAVKIWYEGNLITDEDGNQND